MSFRFLCALKFWSVLSAGLIALHCSETRAQTGAPQVFGTRQAESVQSSTGCEWRLHSGYSVFATQLSLPQVIVINDRSLDIGGLTRLEFGGTNQNQATSALADRLQVPVATLDRLVQNLSTNTHIKGQELADSFRKAVIDFRFLEDRWTRVHPPQIDLEIKTQALNALRAGDIDRAWALFECLPRPRPPQGLRVVETH